MTPRSSTCARASPASSRRSSPSYGQRVAVVGDLAPHLAAREALRAFVREANRGRQLWFVADAAELDARLGR